MKLGQRLLSSSSGLKLSSVQLTLESTFHTSKGNNQRFIRLLPWKLSVTVLWIFVSHKGMFTIKWKFCHHHIEVVFSKYWSDAMSAFEDELKSGFDKMVLHVSFSKIFKVQSVMFCLKLEFCIIILNNFKFLNQKIK